MGTRAKILVSILLITIVGLGVWQLTSPPLMPPVGAKYTVPGPYSNRGSWVILETMSHGKVFLAISIANLTYAKTTLPTDYSVVLSVVNQTISGSYVRGYGAKVAVLTIQDNYDGSTSKWGKGNDLSDAVQAWSFFNFQTSTVHNLRFTVSYDLYDLLIIGYVADHSNTQSFNVTQTVL